MPEILTIGDRNSYRINWLMMSNLSRVIVVTLLTVLCHGLNCQNVSPPTGVSFRSVTSTSLIVQWNVTVSHTVYTYKVFYQKKTDTNNWSTITVDNATTEVTLTGLHPFTDYIVQVLVNSSSGISNKSIGAEVKTNEDFPSAFPVITKKKATSTSIYIEWSPIPKDKENGFLLGYSVYYIRNSDINDYKNKYKHFTVDIRLRTATITALQSHTLYHFGVAAFNRKGIDASAVTWNQVNTLRTKEGVPNAPLELKASFRSLSILKISWLLLTLEQANGIVQRYHCIVLDSLDQVVANKTASNTTDSIEIRKGVLACSGYVIKVRASTSVGYGNYSAFKLENSCKPPRITYIKPNIATALHSRYLVLPCNYTGFPKPTMYWIFNDGAKVEPGYCQYHNVMLPGGTSIFSKSKCVYANGSIVINFVESTDKGLHTCVINGTKYGFGSANATSTVIVSGGTLSMRFELRLLNEQFHKDLEDKDSQRHKDLSSKFTSAIRKMFNNTKLYDIQNIKIILFRSGSVIAMFEISASFESPKDKTLVSAAIVDVMVAGTAAGKIGNLSVGNLTAYGSPPPPIDLKIVRLRSKYIILEWKPPKHAAVYEIDTFSMQYKKHGETDFKSVKTVKNSGPEIFGQIDGLEGGRDYFVKIMSHRKTGDTQKESQGTTIEIKTPDSEQLKMVLLTIVLPVVLALLIVFVIGYVLRRHCREPEQQENRGLSVIHTTEENPYDIGRLLEEFPCKWKELPRSDVQIGKELGSGAFGTVVKALVKLDAKTIPCAVKMLKDFATERERRDLFNELSIMTQVGYHPHVISLLGACTVNGPLWVVVKLAENGCLLDYLHEHRKPDYVDHAYQNVAGSSNDAIEEITKLQKLKFAHGIAQGMSHLDKMKCVHRDLAARNVLLGKQLVAMVSDFGLSRDIYESGMYEDVRGGKRPVRWMAPESIEDYKCTTKSDVWSFGVTLWEIETSGTIPYAGVESGMDILNEIKKGYRLEQPTNCDDDVYDVMLSTWRPNPLDRPTFQELAGTIEEMLVGISEYLELQPDDEYQDVFISAYDEVNIDNEDFDFALQVCLPNNNSGIEEPPPYSLDMDNSETHL